MSEQKQPFWTPKRRLLTIVVLFIAFAIIGRYTGVNDYFTTENIRRQVARAGAWGLLLYIAVFSLGELLHIPGMVFVAVGILAYGKLWGFAAALAASIVSVSTSFLVIRAVGGKALAEIERPWLQRIFARLDKKPILAVFYLRLFLWLAPALNYALAMTNLRFRHYVAGSTLGLVFPVLGATLFFDWFFSIDL